MYNFKEVEEKILKLWKDKDIHNKVNAKNKGGEKFYFLQGPPYTSGRLHIGHAWNNSMKDMILRFKRLKGFDVWDRAGYDMHGLPTENKVQAKFELKTKEDIVAFGLDKFIKECRNFSETNAKQMDADLLRLGIWMDYEHAYWPIKNEFISGEWLLIKKAFEQDRLYKGKKVMTWCRSCETALAKHELEYENVSDDSIFLKFKLENTENEYVIIWTTTPWTIPFNMGIMVNPDVDYVKVKVEDEFWIIAKSLAGPFLNTVLDKQFEVVEEFKGTELEGKHYIHPLRDEIPFDEVKTDNMHSIVLSKDYVDTLSGSGLVHMGTGCGPEDYDVGMENNIKPFNKLNEQGEYEDMGPYTGIVAKQDDKKLIGIFKEKGFLLAVTKVEHEYPHCWRCHKPVIFRTTEQWFMKTKDLCEQILKFNNDVNWVPEESNNSFKLWIENLKDNSITRQRFWGCPVPIWECECGSIEVIGSSRELEEKAIGELPADLHKPWIDEVKIKCKCGKEMARVPDVLDVWLDSGTTSWNCLEYPQREDLLKSLFPADLVLEATEQTRLWFTMLQMGSAIVFNKSAYNNVYCHGMILDYQGTKMSKSLGNIISPYEVVDQYGADILRYYMCQTAAGKNINFNWDTVKLKQRNLNVLWNVKNYLLDLNIQLKKGERAEKGIEEKYILSKLNSTIKSVEEKFNQYRLDETIGDIEDLFLELSRTYIQMIREKAALGSDADKLLISETIKTCLLDILKMLSTITPFVAEEMYQELKPVFGTEEASIHLFSWPKSNKSLINSDLENHMSCAQGIIQSSLAAREKAQVSLRWPVKEIIIHSEDPFVKNGLDELDEVLKKQINVKEINLNKEIEVDYDVKINYKTAGRKFGKDLPKVIAKLAELNGNDVQDCLKKEGKFITKIDDQEFELTQEELVFEKKVPDNFKVSEFSKGTVFLNTERNKDLETEGFARELMRHVQQLRKDNGLERKNLIKLHIQTEFKDIELYSEHIKDKCGVSGITISNVESEMNKIGEINIKNQKFTIYFDQK
ncbi:isoleucine--tRNA ligase [Candidatus Woesearchaeota archaeon]|jgi:isoleucyl-tRNA synthetase|nr:isoleucine--tRNA ligase [Candidatus Woesearchaeota archaeon]MBT4368276.1 isoleucine--tRNA ligase [Candidatus Woesearchaeota archaeon]MBT4712765.1 isoleucine--tRNA ligase [Candidatus Woesearchaeota archaeon]MBT6639677.1 isoleucine--tRNA ligase [Candidatus Woesearchaeota archaeon]MBT7133849.1 isoleucine--tRNA ligase [Candidatus Woesearchaeota archaeon]